MCVVFVCVFMHVHSILIMRSIGESKIDTFLDKLVPWYGRCLSRPLQWTDRWSIQVGTQRPSESKGLGRDFTGNLSQDNLVAQRKIGGRIHAVYSV